MKCQIVAVLMLAALNAHAQSTPGISVLASPVGRYVFGQIGTFRSDQYLLDTQTGRLWKVSCIKSDGGVGCETIGLLPAVFVDTNGSTVGTSPQTATVRQ